MIWYHIPAPCMSQQDRGRNWLDQSVLLSLWYMSLPDTCDRLLLTRATCYCLSHQGLLTCSSRSTELGFQHNNRKLMRLRREEMHEWTYFQHFLTFIIKNKPQNNGGQAVISDQKKLPSTLLPTFATLRRRNTKPWAKLAEGNYYHRQDCYVRCQNVSLVFLRKHFTASVTQRVGQTCYMLCSLRIIIWLGG